MIPILGIVEALEMKSVSVAYETRALYRKIFSDFVLVSPQSTLSPS